MPKLTALKATDRSTGESHIVDTPKEIDRVLSILADNYDLPKYCGDNSPVRSAAGILLDGGTLKTIGFVYEKESEQL